MPDVYTQGNLGSCTAQAISGVFEFDIRRQKCSEYFTPSRLFIYYNERVIQGTVEEDSGASLRDGIKVVHKIGVPTEKDYPYDISRFQVEPSMSVYINAQKHKSIKYKRVPQNNSILSALVLGYPLAFGMSVYEYFETPEFQKSGILKVPRKDERHLGGHAAVLCGYRTAENGCIQFLVRNSWGSSWCLDGHFWMEYAYVMDPNLCADFWTIEKVVNNECTNNKVIETDENVSSSSIIEEEVHIGPPIGSAPIGSPIEPEVVREQRNEHNVEQLEKHTEEPYMFGSDCSDCSDCSDSEISGVD
jgi:C1A family cysteine protease